MKHPFWIRNSPLPQAGESLPRTCCGGVRRTGEGLLKLKKGFTLIEVMVALLIFAIVSVLAAQGLKILIRSHEAIQIQSDRLEELQIGLALMGRNITQAIDRSITNEQNTPQAAFLGQSTYMEFTHGGNMNPQESALRSTLQRTAYLLNNGALTERDWPVLDRTAKTLARDRILIQDVTALRFRYIDAKSQQYDSWPQQNLTLPRAVQITLTLKHRGDLRRVFILPGQALSEN